MIPLGLRLEENHQTKIVDNVLWIKTDFAIYGYLNAPSPLLRTAGSLPEIKLRLTENLLNFWREEEIINVGGLKVYPQEVEDVLLQLGNVTDAIVREKRILCWGISCGEDQIEE